MLLKKHIWLYYIIYKYAIIHIISSYTTFTIHYVIIYICIQLQSDELCNHSVPQRLLFLSSCPNARIVILQGETQSGKTNLLRHAIPWYRRWTIWPLSMVCWRGIYMNGLSLGSWGTGRYSKENRGAWDICHVHYKGYCFNCCLYHLSHFICVDTYIYNIIHN